MRPTPSIETKLEPPTPAPMDHDQQAQQAPMPQTAHQAQASQQSSIAQPATVSTSGDTNTPPKLPGIPQPSSATSAPLSSISPSIRHPLTRPLSPDLPVRDALYVFSNFASYMRSPHEGSEGIQSSTDFRDTIRLLDYARVSVAVLVALSLNHWREGRGSD